MVVVVLPRKVGSVNESARLLCYPQPVCRLGYTTTKGMTRMDTAIKYPTIKVKLTGKDGNAFAVMNSVQTALRRGGVSEDDIKEYFAESTSGDYDNLLATACRWVSVS